jgi:hypothetical protein
MPPHATTRPMHVPERDLVHQFTDLPDIEAEIIANHRDFVGERDLNVSVRVFRHLHEFGGQYVSDIQFGLDDRRVQPNHHLSKLRR